MDGYPSQREARWKVGGAKPMLWVRRDIECEQVSVPSADLTVALLRLPDRSVLVASVYVEGGNAAALDATIDLLTKAIHNARRRGGPEHRRRRRFQPPRPAVGRRGSTAVPTGRGGSYH